MCATFGRMLLDVAMVMTAVVAVVSGGFETRCYCNEAVCVSTGYMCKSTRIGSCYSQLTKDGATVRSTHGCAETLPEVDYGACAMDARRATRRRRSAGSLLLCCGDDMCNYMDSQSLAVYMSEDAGSTKNRSATDNDDGRSSTLPDRLWLRVAIIAVPLAGLCILVPLVAVAVRMLTADRGRAPDDVTSGTKTRPPAAAATFGVCAACSDYAVARLPDRTLPCGHVTDCDETSSGRGRFVFATVHGKRRAGYQQMRTCGDSGAGDRQTRPAASAPATPFRSADGATVGNKLRHSADVGRAEFV